MDRSAAVITGSPIDVIGKAGAAAILDLRDFFMDRWRRRRCLTFGRDGLWIVQAVDTLLLWPS